MSRRNRCDVIDESEVGVYHTYSQCARQSYLFGRDKKTGVDRSHRRGWLLELMEYLVATFAIDASAFAVLMNHFHLILRNRPDLAEEWSASEVAIRWWRVSNRRKLLENPHLRPRDGVIDGVVRDAKRVATLRRRLASPSWFMKELKQPLARRANKEDEVTGHFFAERFGAIKLSDELDVVAANIYVDLNEVRAGICTSIEGSQYTSAYRRLSRLKKAESLMLEGDIEQAAYYARSDPDFWLAPIHELGTAPELFVPDGRLWSPPTERSETDGEDSPPDCDDDASPEAERQSSGSRRPLNAERKRRRQRLRRGMLPMTLYQYLRLLDELGRMPAKGKRGVISPGEPSLAGRANALTRGLLQRRIASLATTLRARELPLTARPPSVPEASPIDSTSPPPKSGNSGVGPRQSGFS